ncbi:MAG: tetratricopeptide repeat protein [Chryseobacterium taeanense]
MAKYIYIFTCFLFLSLKSYNQTTTKDSTQVLRTDSYTKSGPSQSNVKPFSYTVDSKDKNTPIYIQYSKLTNEAYNFYLQKKFQDALVLYNQAIKENNGFGKITDRFNLACCYAKLNNSDSAFSELFRIAKSGKFYDIQGLNFEPNLKSLHKDARWTSLLSIVDKNLGKLNEDVNNKQ